RCSDSTNPKRLIQERKAALASHTTATRQASVVNGLRGVLDERLDVRCRSRARGASDLAAAGEHSQGRNRSDPEALAELGHRVRVHLDHQEPPLLPGRT